MNVATPFTAVAVDVPRIFPLVPTTFALTTVLESEVQMFPSASIRTMRGWRVSSSPEALFATGEPAGRATPDCMNWDAVQAVPPAQFPKN